LTGWPWAVWFRGSNIIVDSGKIENLKSSYRNAVGIYEKNVVISNFEIRDVEAPRSCDVGFRSVNVEVRDGKIEDVRGTVKTYGIYDGTMDVFEIEVTIKALDGNNLIRDVEVSGCAHGVHLRDTDGNTVRNCYIHDNEHGIYLNNSSYNTIERNIIENNTLRDTGIHIESGPYNEIHENCFINNEPQAYDNGTNNNWKRNYWDPHPPNYSIPGTAGAKDYDPLPYCPHFTKVPALNIFGLIILVSSILAIAVGRS